MSFQYKTLKLEKLAIIGAGHIGPDIGLHFARTLAPAGSKVVLVDISEEALVQAREKLERKTDREVSKGRMSAGNAQAIKDSVFYTTDYSEIAGANLVLEAATED